MPVLLTKTYESSLVNTCAVMMATSLYMSFRQQTCMNKHLHTVAPGVCEAPAVSVSAVLIALLLASSREHYPLLCIMTMLCYCIFLLLLCVHHHSNAACSLLDH